MTKEQLLESIDALLKLDAANALVPHGIGGHARTLLTEAATALSQAEGAQDGRLDAWTVEACAREADKHAGREFNPGQIAHHIRALPTRPREQDGAEPRLQMTVSPETAELIKRMKKEYGVQSNTELLKEALRRARVPEAHPLPAASFQAGAEAMREAAALKIAAIIRDAVVDGVPSGCGFPQHSGRVLFCDDKRMDGDSGYRTVCRCKELGREIASELPIPARSEGR